MNALTGWRVLIPRGGAWGDDLAERLRAVGAEPVMVPLIAFEEPADDAALGAALADLSAGRFDWLVVTSATTVEALVRHGATVPEGTRVAVVGGHTGQAARDAGLPVAFTPVEASARGLVLEWPGGPGERVLLPQSELADATLVEGLGALGAQVAQVTAYRTVPVAPAEGVAEEVARGAFQAVLVTAGSVAARVADVFPSIPESTALVAIGPRTAGEAATAGLRIAAVADGRSGAAMVDALAAVAAERGGPSTRSARSGDQA
ncbi:MAG: uroporphyrinogen-III synthase [Microbacteriaceae bacterium]|nr:uroporphyrinogen-III synthase [Microbacteriaceae bacterium]